MRFTVLHYLLTLEAVGVEKILALFVAFNTALSTPDPLIKRT